MMILLCKLAIKSEGTRFTYTMNNKKNNQVVIIFNNFFPYQKT